MLPLVNEYSLFLVGLVVIALVLLLTYWRQQNGTRLDGRYIKALVGTQDVTSPDTR